MNTKGMFRLIFSEALFSFLSFFSGLLTFVFSFSLAFCFDCEKNLEFINYGLDQTETSMP